MESFNFDETPENKSEEETSQAIAHHVSEILKLIGEDTTREGLKKTPLRVANSLQFFTQGSHKENSVEELLSSALFTNAYEEMVIVKNIEFYSLCEHHLLPFYGHVHVAYIPNGKIIGLSKIPRVIEVYARRLQIQEQLTIQIRDAIQNHLNPKGVAVVIEAHHMCMMIRGVQKHQSTTITSALSGDFLLDPKTREEFTSLIRR